MSYLFYDTETTGLSSSFDQVLQFAALNVDDDLNEVDSINLRCRILPYIVPSPEALLATKVSPALLVNAPLCSREMAQQIHDWLGRRSPATIMGHNSIQFDEDFIRQKFYQNLLPIYLTNTNGNQRADTMRTAQATAIYRPGVLNVPLTDKGNPSFKLGPLVRANGITFDEESAHDALADVRATLDLARLLKNRAADIWDQMQRMANKNLAIQFMTNHHFFFNSEVYYGKPFTYLACSIAANPNNSAEIAVFDLNIDPTTYLGMSSEQLLEVIKGKDKVIRTVAANKQPMLADDQLCAFTLPISREQIIARANQIKENTTFCARVAEALSHKYDDLEPSVYVEQRIFEGFPSQQDLLLMQQYHVTPLQERRSLCESLGDARFKELAIRMLFFENPELLTTAERQQLHLHYRERLMSEADVSWLTIPKAFDKINDLRKKISDHSLLNDIEDFITQMRTRILADAV